MPEHLGRLAHAVVVGTLVQAGEPGLAEGSVLVQVSAPDRRRFVEASVLHMWVPVVGFVVVAEVV